MRIRTPKTEATVELGHPPPPNQDACLGLSELLLAVLVGGSDPHDVGRRAGRLIGEAWVRCSPAESLDPVAQLRTFLETRGFGPRETRSDSAVVFVLSWCPFEMAARANPALMRRLDRALLEGVVEALGGIAITTLAAERPAGAACRLELRRTDPRV